MKKGEGPVPDQKTYVSLLGACSHSFDANEAKNIWLNEMEDVAMKHDCFVIAALVDSVSRMGHLHEAYEWILKYEKYTERKQLDEIMWTSLLSACRTYKQYLLAQHVFSEIVCRFKENKSFMQEMSLRHSNIFKTLDAFS